jgi:hypothetical protein
MSLLPPSFQAATLSAPLLSTFVQSENVVINLSSAVIVDNLMFRGLEYQLVTSPNPPHRVWLDRNLGATKVAASSNDSAAKFTTS